MAYFREDMADIRVTVDGVPYGDSWFSAEGAVLESDDTKTRAGGMGKEVSLGGPSSRDDCTVMIQMSDIVLGWHKTLEQAVMDDAPMKVALTFLDRKRAPTGASQVVVGVIKSAALPDMDTGSNNAAFYKIVLSCDEQAG